MRASAEFVGRAVENGPGREPWRGEEDQEAGVTCGARVFQAWRCLPLWNPCGDLRECRKGGSPSSRIKRQGKGKETTGAEEAAPAVLADIVPRSRYEAHPEGPVDARPVDAPTGGTALAETHGVHLQ